MTPLLRGLTRVVLGTLLGSLLLVTLILGARRLAGELTIPLEWPALLAAGLLLALTCGACRFLGLKTLVPEGPLWMEHVIRWAPLACCSVLSATILLPGTSSLAAGLYLAVVGAEELIACCFLPWQFRLSCLDWFASLSRRSPNPLPDETIDQQFTRLHSSAGEDTFHGWLRIRFLPGQRTAIANLAFCPPFERSPHVTFQQQAGPESRINLDQVLPFGVRLEAKLPEAATEPTAVLLRVVAIAESEIDDTLEAEAEPSLPFPRTIGSTRSIDSRPSSNTASAESA